MNKDAKEKNYLEEVRNQYENYPYPYRNPELEKNRLINTTLDSLDLVNFTCFSGKKNFYDNFRVLIAGGGTGDSSTFLAEQLRDTDAEIIYLDISTASMAIAKRRIEIRRLHKNIKFIHASLLDIPKLNLGKFDYINCSGVLHHLESPEDGLKSLRSALKDDGVMALMVYGKYGRTGVYEMQQLMRLINSDVKDARKKVELTKKVIAKLPEGNWFKANEKTFRGDIELFGDIGIYDLLLHSQDRAYTVSEIYEWVEKYGLNLISFNELNGLHKMFYDPSYYIKDPELKAQFDKMSLRERQAAAEIITGKFYKHSFYVSPVAREAPSIDNLDNIPFFSSALNEDNVGKKMYIFFSDEGNTDYIIENGNVKVQLTKKEFTVEILKYLDGKRTTNEIIDSVISDEKFAGNKISRDAVYEDFKRIYKMLNTFNWMILRDKTSPAIFKSRADMQRLFNESEVA